MNIHTRLLFWTNENTNVRIKPTEKIHKVKKSRMNFRNNLLYLPLLYLFASFLVIERIGRFWALDA